jgi:hypothetical protein
VICVWGRGERINLGKKKKKKEQSNNRIRSRAPWSPIFVLFENSHFEVSKNSNIKFVMLPMT